ncbi:MAG: ribonuclease D [Alphaproteobacteria bacterium]|nr:ribonuclease D [Alphaproteobacteria bacterium]HCQ71216.1 ribonuclease D [Rhodospirillaceae bacterium]|tara:strand:- start:17762 stop:18382 length:621 start_codon:yes stop_codon:yes gene_type:complete
MKDPVIHFHRGDLPDDVQFSNVIGVDTETMGLNLYRDPLCVVQLSDGDGEAHVVQLDRQTYDAPNLKAVLGDQSRIKIFHYARFDVAVIRQYLDTECTPVYCTRTVSRLVRTYTDRHGLRECCRDLLRVDINKQQQSTDWGAEDLSDAQLLYAATDVLHLHKLKAKMDMMLERAGRTELAQKCFDFIPVRAELDALGWGSQDLFEH